MAYSYDEDEAPSGLSTPDYVLHLWRRRFWIVGMGVLVLVLCYCILRFFASSIYEANAMLMVRPQPRINDIERDQTGIQAPAFRNIVVSDHVIESVRRQYRDWRKTNTDATSNPTEFPDLTTPLEKLRYRFKAKSATTVDTTVSTEFSPVIEISARGESPGQAMALMNLWIEFILNNYGNLTNDEATFLAKSSNERMALLRKEAETLNSQYSEAETKRRLVEARIGSALRQLTNAPIKDLDDEKRRMILPYNIEAGPRDTRVTVNESTSGEPGLWERRTAVEVELAGLRTDVSKNSDRIAAAQGELQRITDLATTIEADIANYSKEAAQLDAQISALDAQLIRVEYAVQLSASVASQGEAMMRSVDPTATGSEKYSTIRLLAPPAVPGLRVWPQRTLLAGISAAVTVIFVALLFMGELYIRHAMTRQEHRGD